MENRVSKIDACMRLWVHKRDVESFIKKSIRQGKDTVECSALNGTFVSHLLPSTFSSHCKRSEMTTTNCFGFFFFLLFIFRHTGQLHM